MPEAPWDTYRLGAYLPSLRGLVTSDAHDQVDRLQSALSSVAYMLTPTVAAAPATDDARFVGRLLLGLLCRGWPTFSSPDVELALLEASDAAAGLLHRSLPGTGQIGWSLGRDGSTPRQT